MKVPGRRRGCQGRRPRLGAGASVRGGRGGWENVTCARRRSASTGPMPRTCCNASSDPNGPRAVRSSMIRVASAGPIPGRRSSSSAVATSMSTGPVRTGPVGRCSTGSRERGRGVPLASADFACRPAPAAEGRRRAPPAAMAESTWEIWTASAALASRSPTTGRRARQPRTPIPSAATAATKSSAWRSPGVGTTPRYGARPRSPNPRIALVMKSALTAARTTVHRCWPHSASDGAIVAHHQSYQGAKSRITASATSPTSCSVERDTLSAVSSVVWCQA